MSKSCVLGCGRNSYRSGLCWLHRRRSVAATGVEERELAPVDVEFIRSLRLDHKYFEARQLLLARRKVIAKQRKRDIVEVNVQLRRKENVWRRVNGVCTVPGCKFLAVEGYARCEFHLSQAKKYKEKLRRR